MEAEGDEEMVLYHLWIFDGFVHLLFDVYLQSNDYIDVYFQIASDDAKLS